MQDSVEVRVARGMSALDEAVPGWRERLDMDELDMSTACKCILGQVFRAAAFGAASADLTSGYEVGLQALNPGWRDNGGVNDDVPLYQYAISHGFSIGDATQWQTHQTREQAWRQLDEAWRLALTPSPAEAVVA